VSIVVLTTASFRLLKQIKNCFMTFPNSGFPTESQARFPSLWHYSHTFNKFVNIRLQQLLSRLSIKPKISYRHAFVIGIVVLGTVMGLSFGDSYREQMAVKLTQAQAEERLLSQLQISVLETRIAQQELSNVLQQSKQFSTQQVHEAKLKLLKQLKQLNKYHLQTELAQREAFRKLSEKSSLKYWIEKNEILVDTYKQKIDAILLDINPVKVELKTIQLARMLLLDFNQSQVAIAFSNLARDLTQLIEYSQQEQQEAAIALEQIETLQLKIISITTLLSVMIAAAIATYTSRAIANPLESATQVARQVTEEDQFHPETPGRTEDEIGELTTSVNHLVQRVANNTKELQQTQTKFERFFNLLFDLFRIAGFDGYFKRLNTAFETGYEIDYRTIWSDGTLHGLREKGDVLPDETGRITAMAGTIIDITQRQQKEEELRQSEARYRELANRETLLNRLASQIRHSLDLDTILDTAVIEIRNLLQLDRCFFFWHRPDTTSPHWEIVQEAKNPDLPSFINNCVPVTEIQTLMAKANNPEIKIITIGNTWNLHNLVERNFFMSLGYSAVLLIPIHTQSGEIGIICCTHTSKPRFWGDTEIEMLQAVGDQIAIAIDQAQLLQQSRLATATAVEQATKLELTLSELQQTQTQLVQSEKMSSLGQLVAGIAHEINNPISFIYGNVIPIKEYAEDLFSLIQLYQDSYPCPTPEIQAKLDTIDLDFIKADLPKILSSMKTGSDRIRQIVLSLRNFSRLDEAEMKQVDIHEGLNNTLLILSHRLNSQHPEQPGIQVIKDYGNLPKVQCYPGQLNQVFMNILTNAIEAIEAYNKQRSLKDLKNRPGTISICTEVLDSNQAIILIGDNGLGMTEEVNRKLFDPFFTTKPIGSGTGLGMTISYKIVVEKHGGQLQCISAPNQGAAILIQIPIQQPNKGDRTNVTA
jgi:signal transduction histidine kinase/PAS domain-containing protein